MGIWLAIKLLGGGIVNFIKANWKWVLPLLAAIAAYFYVNHLIDTARQEGHDAGYAQAQEEYKTKLAEEDARNRKFEERLKLLLGDWGVTIVKEAMERVSKETILKETLRETIRDNPVYEQCIADTQAIQTRNQIRALGPIKVKEVASAPIEDNTND